jgi:hypothetical protein
MGCRRARSALRYSPQSPSKVPPSRVEGRTKESVSVFPRPGSHRAGGRPVWRGGRLYLAARVEYIIPPCLPTKAREPPRGDAWLHEIKHDGFRIIARKQGDRVRLYSRPGTTSPTASR